VRVKAALTCGTDLKAFTRGHPLIPMPGPFGHEFSGIVSEIGKGVRKFKKGDHIMSAHSAPCLACPYCKSGTYNLCESIMTTKVLGAFAEFVLLPRHVVSQNAYKKPRSLSFEEAALLEPLACVVHGLGPLHIKKGDTALVIGAGPIGLMHVLLLKDLGAKVAIADPHQGRLKLARALGADRGISASRDRSTDAGRIRRSCSALVGGPGFDHVFECTGRPEAWEASVDHLRRGGTATLFGGPPSGTNACFNTHRLHYDELTLRGSFHFTPADVKISCETLINGKLRVNKLISASYPLRDITKAFARLKKGQGVKYAILP